jgi:hypothetical protein
MVSAPYLSAPRRKSRIPFAGLRAPRRPAARVEGTRRSFDLHLELLVRELAAGGLDERAARREAPARLGDRRALAAACGRQARGTERRLGWSVLVDEPRQDIAYAMRQLVRARSFTAMALLTLAAGLGATTAPVSLVDLPPAGPGAPEGPQAQQGRHQRRDPGRPDGDRPGIDLDRPASDGTPGVRDGHDCEDASGDDLVRSHHRRLSSSLMRRSYIKLPWGRGSPAAGRFPDE